MFPYLLQLQVEDEHGMNMCTENSLTLRRLLVWMYDPKVRLKTLAALVDFCQGGWGLCVHEMGPHFSYQLHLIYIVLKTQHC